MWLVFPTIFGQLQFDEKDNFIPLNILVIDLEELGNVNDFIEHEFGMLRRIYNLAAKIDETVRNFSMVHAVCINNLNRFDVSILRND